MIVSNADEGKYILRKVSKEETQIIKECFVCGKKDKPLELHHLIYEPQIVIPVCKSCHKKIHYSKDYIYNQFKIFDRNELNRIKSVLTNVMELLNNIKDEDTLDILYKRECNKSIQEVKKIKEYINRLINKMRFKNWDYRKSKTIKNLF